MRIGGRGLVGVGCGTFLLAAACGGGDGGAGGEQAAAALTSEAVEQMKTPENPYGIIYYPPVSLGKAVDTTRRGVRPD